jgi:hypothetical protein
LGKDRIEQLVPSLLPDPRTPVRGAKVAKIHVASRNSGDIIRALR